MTCRPVTIGATPAIVCGEHPPSADDLAALANVLRITQGGGTMAEAREAAGLSVGQAAKLFGVRARDLRALESGEAKPSNGLRVMMLAAYDVEAFVDDAAR